MSEFFDKTSVVTTSLSGSSNFSISDKCPNKFITNVFEIDLNTGAVTLKDAASLDDASLAFYKGLEAFGFNLIDRNKQLEAKIENQATRIKYLEGATNHAGGTPLSQALARAEKAELKVKELNTYIKKLDGIIEEVGGVTMSCINPYEDLKRALIYQKERAEKAEAELIEINSRMYFQGENTAELCDKLADARKERDNYKKSVENAHKVLDESGVIIEKDKSHQGLTNRIKSLIAKCKKAEEALLADIKLGDGVIEELSERAEKAEERITEWSKILVEQQSEHNKLMECASQKFSEMKARADKAETEVERLTEENDKLMDSLTECRSAAGWGTEKDPFDVDGFAALGCPHEVPGFVEAQFKRLEERAAFQCETCELKICYDSDVAYYKKQLAASEASRNCVNENLVRITAECDALKVQLSVNPHVYGKIRIAELEVELAELEAWKRGEFDSGDDSLYNVRRLRKELAEARNALVEMVDDAAKTAEYFYSDGIELSSKEIYALLGKHTVAINAARKEGN
jgi:hypothetical protein